jgi:hypothetical protein
MKQQSNYHVRYQIESLSHQTIDSLDMFFFEMPTDEQIVDNLIMIKSELDIYKKNIKILYCRLYQID